jgi:hypothetical protein
MATAPPASRNAKRSRATAANDAPTPHNAKRSNHSRANATGFLDLPDHLQSKVIERLPDEYDRMKLSTCHSSLACFDYVGDITIALPAETRKIAALSQWARSKTGVLRTISIRDERDTFGAMEETVRDRLMDGLAAAGKGLEVLSVVSKSTPYRALFPVMQHAKLAHFPENNPFPADLSLETCATLETLLITEIENAADADTAIDLGGIAKAPALRNLYVLEQRGRVWFDDLPLLKDTLEHLIVIGTEGEYYIVDNMAPFMHMSKLRVLILDSASANASVEMARAMPLLERFDLSRRHKTFDWNIFPEDIEAFFDTAGFYDAVKELEHLKELGCGDIVLTDEFEAPTVTTLHTSILAFLLSFSCGFSTANVPMLETIVIDGAFKSVPHDQVIVTNVLGALKVAKPFTLKLKKTTHSDLHNDSTTMDTFWCNVAQAVPHITISIY